MTLKKLQELLQNDGFIWSHEVFAYERDLSNLQNAVEHGRISTWLEENISLKIYTRTQCLYPNIDKGVFRTLLIHKPDFNLEVLRVPVSKARL